MTYIVIFIYNISNWYLIVQYSFYFSAKIFHTFINFESDQL